MYNRSLLSWMWFALRCLPRFSTIKRTPLYCGFEVWLCWIPFIVCECALVTILSLFDPDWGPNPNYCLIRTSRSKLNLIRLSWRKLTLIRFFRPKIPLIRLCRHEGSLIILFRPTAFWSDHLQTMIQTQIQTIAQTLIRLWSESSALEEVMIRPSCACSHLLSDWNALNTSFDQTRVRSKNSDQRKILYMNKSLNFAIIYSFH